MQKVNQPFRRKCLHNLACTMVSVFPTNQKSDLKPHALSVGSSLAIVPFAQPKRRRNGRKSMSRRSGQNGTIVIQSGFYRVRWRMDVEDQEERINMTAKIAPVVLDKLGNPKPRRQKYDARRGELSNNPVRTRKSISTLWSWVKSHFESRRKSISNGLKLGIGNQSRTFRASKRP